MEGQTALLQALLSGQWLYSLTLMHPERPELYTILAFLSAVGFNQEAVLEIPPSSFNISLGFKVSKNY